MEAAVEAAVEAAARRRRSRGRGDGEGGGAALVPVAEGTFILEVRLRRTRLEAYRLATGPDQLIARMPPPRSAIATSDSLSLEPAERSASRGANARISPPSRRR